MCFYVLGLIMSQPTYIIIPGISSWLVERGQKGKEHTLDFHSFYNEFQPNKLPLNIFDYKGYT